MTTRTQFEEELRKLGVLDQKAASLMNGNALLFAGASLADFSSINVLGNCADIAIVALQLILMSAGFFALRAARMMENIGQWPIRDDHVTDAEYGRALTAITAVVKKRCGWIERSWTLTMVGILFLMILVVFKAL